MNCPITGCPIKHILLSFILAFAAISGFDYVFHTVYMMDSYIATAELWRSEETMPDYLQFMTIAQAIRAFAFAGIFAWLCKCAGGSSIALGLKFGLLAGLFLGSSAIACYAYMPIPLELSLKWFAGEIAQAMLVGIILSFVCGRKASCCKKEEA